MRFQTLTSFLLLSAAPLALAQSSYPVSSTYVASSQSTTTLTSTATMTKTITVSQVVASVTSTYGVQNSTMSYPTGTGSAPVPSVSKTVPSPISVASGGAATNLNGVYAGSAGMMVAIAAAFL